MATHSSFLAWEIPWTEEPGGLQSLELQRVGHNLATKQQLHTHTHTHTQRERERERERERSLDGQALRLAQFTWFCVVCETWRGSPREGNGNPLQFSCLGNPMDRGLWATVHGVAKSRTRLSN